MGSGKAHPTPGGFAIEDPAAASDLPREGILSKTLYEEDAVKVVAFGFAAGEGLSEHTATVPAVLQVVSGEGTITVGERRVAAREGTWIYLPAHCPHAVEAASPLRLLLVLLRAGEASAKQRG